MVRCGVKGRVHIVLRDAQGKTIEDVEIHNQETDVGIDALSSLWASDLTEAKIDALAIGRDGTPPTINDTALGDEITSDGGERRSGANVTAIKITKVITNDTVEWKTTFTFTGSPGVLVEYGLFNDPSTGTLISRVTHSPLNPSTGIELDLTWTLQLARL